MRNERIDLLTKHKKDILFVDKWLIMPAAYRDMNLQKMQQSTDEINSYYTKLIRLANMSVDGNNFDFMLYNTQFNIQMELVRIYDYLKNIIEKKNGAIIKSLIFLSSSTTLSTQKIRTVIPLFSPLFLKSAFPYFNTKLQNPPTKPNKKGNRLRDGSNSQEK